MTNTKITRTIFFEPKNKRLARIISITSPTAFKRSIMKLSENGLSLRKRKALVLARTRAKLQLRRKNLSPKERKQFTEISKMKIPPVSKRKRL